MNQYEESMKVMKQLFTKDYQFALATARDNIPTVRFVDTFYDDGCFYIVTYRTSRKVQEVEVNENVSLCNKMYGFQGIAHNIGHPCDPANAHIRAKLIQAFEPWYFAHNNENDENMCYLKIELMQGFFYQNGKGYRTDFINQTAESFPFTYDMVEV